MKIFDYINNNTLLIVPNSIRTQILEFFNASTKIIDVKIMSLDELKKRLYFDYEIETKLYLMDRYNMEVDYVDTVLDSLYYIDDKKYDDSKLDFLVSIKKELNDNNLIIYDKVFNNYIKTKDVLVYGYTKIEKLLFKALEKMNAKIIKEDGQHRNNKVFLSKTLEDEVVYVFNKISELLSNGVSLNNIKLTNVNDKYLYTIKRVSSMFSIPVLIDDESIYSSTLAKDFIRNLSETRSFELSLNYLNDNYDISKQENLNIYSLLLNISNKYNDYNYSFESIYKLVVNDIKHSKVRCRRSKEMLEIVDFNNNVFDSSMYVFLLNFNLGEIPLFYKDEDFISDKLKVDNGLCIDTTMEQNIISKKSVLEMIENTSNLFISAKEKSIDSEYMISNLAKELNFDIENVKPNYLKSYSCSNSKVQLTKSLDNLIKYGVKDSNLDLLYSNYNVNYLTYSNKFDGINKPLFLNDLTKLVLSYTQLDNFYHCSFKYYLSYILKIDKYEENFSTVIGNLFHYILSICFNENFDFEYEYNQYVSKLSLNYKELFFINKLKSELFIIVNSVKKMHDESGLTNLLLEHKITIDKSSVIPVFVTGIIDKLMYKEKENTLVSIVDYKTGSVNIDLYNVIYGFSMQLPIYLYLVKKSDVFKNVKFSGFYLQKLLSGEVNYSVSKTYLEQKESNLRLEGYSNSDVSKLEVFMPDYENSKFIKSMKVSSKGFYQYSKILSDEQMDKLIDIVDKNIENARDNIIDAKFDINPKQIGSDRVGCDFCKFRDICYKTNNDFVKLEVNKSLDFLNDDGKE